MSLQDNVAQCPNTPVKHSQMPVGGFIIDGQGREVPITEDMIQQACNALEESRQSAHQQG
ncbi:MULTISPECIES: PA1571 family protein [Pseudomonas]|uniref:PA1571 family protein n=1 Tax=Pseudomonas TaxID=286 RepID=UPI00137974AC|nr:MULTISPECIES: PA1571 family protein [Pseudomonas]